MDNFRLPQHNQDIALRQLGSALQDHAAQGGNTQAATAQAATVAQNASQLFSSAASGAGRLASGAGGLASSAMGGAWGGVKNASSFAWNGVKASGSALGSFAASPIQNKAWGALGGHAVQQMLTCGLPTMLREEAFIEAYNAMLPHLVEQHPYAAVGMQMGVSLASVGAQLYLREPRLARDPNGDEVAVRGHFGLSPDEATQIKADDVERRANGETEQWPALVAKHQAASKRVTGQQVMAELMNTGMSVAGAATGNHALTARVLSTQLRNIAYAYTREPLQAAVSTTAGREGRPTFGVNNEHMRTNAAWYTGMTLAMGTLQDSLISSALPKGYSVSGPEIRDAQGQRLTGGELHEMAALVSGLRAVCNTAIETADAFLGKHYDTKQSGDTQKFKPSLPMKDFERVLDHSIARLSWNNFATGSNLAAQQALTAISKGKIPSQVSGALNNIGTAAAFGLTYNMVNQIYQAHAKVRGAVAAARPADEEAPPPPPLVNHGPPPVLPEINVDGGVDLGEVPLPRDSIDSVLDAYDGSDGDSIDSVLNAYGDDARDSIDSVVDAYGGNDREASGSNSVENGRMARGDNGSSSVENRRNDRGGIESQVSSYDRYNDDNV